MTYGMIFWLGRLLRSPRLWVIAVVLFGTLWVRATLATHSDEGHSNLVWEDFEKYDLPADLVLGDVGLAPLTVSMHPSNGIDAGSHISHGVGDWNFQLSNNSPSSLGYNVLQWVGDNQQADIIVTVDPNNCGSTSWACTQVMVDDPDNGGIQGHIFIRSGNWVNGGATADYAMTHELGHAISGVNDEYGAGGPCFYDSVMGLGSFSPPCPVNVTGHDNDDFYDIFRQNSQLVPGNRIKQYDEVQRLYRVEWEFGLGPNNEARMHGESNFIIARAPSVDGNYDFYSWGSRNTQHMNGVGCCTGGKPTFIEDMGQGDEWCFRTRTATQAYPNTRSEHFGIETNGDCISRSPDSKTFLVTRTDGERGTVHVQIRNDLGETATNLRFVGSPSCTLSQITLPAGGYSHCSFSSTDQIGSITIRYERVSVGFSATVTDVIGYDSHASH